MSWNEVSFIVASKTRKAILLRLDSPTTPTTLAKEMGLNLSNISRALTELEGKRMVECLTPKQRVGKIYSLTKKGIKTAHVIDNLKKK